MTKQTTCPTKEKERPCAKPKTTNTTFDTYRHRLILVHSTTMLPFQLSRVLPLLFALVVISTFQGRAFAMVTSDPITFTVDYFLSLNQQSSTNELDKIISATQSHLSLFFSLVFADNTLTHYNRIEVMKKAVADVPAPLEVTYDAYVVFDESAFIPSQAELEQLLASAFRESSQEWYIQRLLVESSTDVQRIVVSQ